LLSKTRCAGTGFFFVWKEVAANVAAEVAANVVVNVTATLAAIIAGMVGVLGLVWGKFILFV